MESRALGVVAVWLWSWPALTGCAFVGGAAEDVRLDPDGDGVLWPDDCDDTDPDLGELETWYLDLDGDGWGGASEEACGRPSKAYVTVGGDCNDGDPLTLPGAPEFCDGHDDDCDGEIDEDDAVDALTWYRDGDGDGIGNMDDSGTACSLPDGASEVGGDCDDADETVYPGATELCDGVDNDCDEEPGTEEVDGDGDGYVVCTFDAGGWIGDDGVLGGGDCDDTNPVSYPGSTERCDGVDNDCDGSLPDVELDADADGVVACTFDEDGWLGDVGVVGDEDCDDADETVYPGATELCDGQDNDCDGSLPNVELDADGDGGVECAWVVEVWLGTSDVESGEDCDAADETVYAGATELCDGKDNDCDGDLDDTEIDDDGDDYVDCTEDGGGWDAVVVPGFGDCDDTSSAARETFPGAAWIESSTDCMRDVDLDGYGDDSTSGGVTAGTDCDDSDGGIKPDADDVCSAGGGACSTRCANS